jgi:hypothetical protein
VEDLVRQAIILLDLVALHHPKIHVELFLMVVDHALLGITHPVKAAFLIDLF